MSGSGSTSKRASARPARPGFVRSNLEPGPTERSSRASVKALRVLLRGDAFHWGVPAWAAEVVLLLPIVGGLAVAVMRLHSGLFFWLVDEDSVLEWGQFGLFLVAVVMGALAVWRFATAGRRNEAIAFVIFVLGCILVAGEEISWGQRILGLETPDVLMDANVQAELNTHNLSAVRIGLKFAMIGVGLYGFVVPWVLRVRESQLGPRLGLAVPPLFLTSSFLMLAAYNLGRLVFFPSGFFGVEQNYTLGRFGEWPEFCLSLALALYASLIWRRSRPEEAPAYGPVTARPLSEHRIERTG
jgi:hypothetical protein